MMPINFKCSKKDLLAALKHVSLGVRNRGRRRRGVTMEINFKPGEIELTTIGSRYRVKCETNVYSKVIVPFAYFFKLIKEYQNNVVNVMFEPGRMQLDSLVLKSWMIQVIHPENQKTLDLTLNYTTLDILALREKHSDEELKRLNLLTWVEQEEERLKNVVREAMLLLREYGIKYEDLENLIESRIKELS